MPQMTATLSDKEVRLACAYWVEAECPTPKNSNVHLTVTPGSNDPREPSGPTVSASVKIKT